MPLYRVCPYLEDYTTNHTHQSSRIFYSCPLICKIIVHGIKEAETVKTISLHILPHLRLHE